MGRIIPDIMETKCLKPPTSPIWLLVGGFNPLKKYEFVSWDDDIPNIWTVIKFHGSKPPTRTWLIKHIEGLSHMLWKIKFMFETTSPLYSKPTIDVTY